MFLIDFKWLVQQMIPLHWRTTYREYLIQVMMQPLFSLYQQLIRYRKQIADKPLTLLQTGVLEQELNSRFANPGYLYIEITEGAAAGNIIINITRAQEEKIKQIQQFLQPIMPLGVRYSIRVKE